MSVREYVGKVVLVTGAGSGLGRASAIAFAREGATVVVADVVVKGGNETVDAILDNGGQAEFIAVDISSSESVQSMINTIVQKQGRLDCAFNNAGVLLECCRIGDLDEADFDRTIAVNTRGTFLCMKYEIRQMQKQGGGAIVNTASFAGLKPLTMCPAYTVSKFGVVGMTRHAAVEYAKENIRINAICPGTMVTPMLLNGLGGAVTLTEEAVAAMSPVGHFGEAQDIAEAAVWLCSDKAKYVFGVTLPVDGGVMAQ